jgi:hypothetical protein
VGKAISEDRALGSGKAHHVGSSPPENCSGAKEEVGEGEGGEEGDVARRIVGKVPRNLNSFPDLHLQQTRVDHPDASIGVGLEKPSRIARFWVRDGGRLPSFSRCRHYGTKFSSRIFYLSFVTKSEQSICGIKF